MECSIPIEFSKLQEGEGAECVGCGEIPFRSTESSTNCGGCVLLIADWFSCLGSNFDGQSVGC